jgi:hypothetical protein
MLQGRVASRPMFRLAQWIRLQDHWVLELVGRVIILQFREVLLQIWREHLESQSDLVLLIQIIHGLHNGVVRV